MLNSASQTLLIDGPSGAIEVGLDRPEGAAVGVALVAHPHPLYGGTRENKVVQTLARALLALGYVCLSPNFRGVGDSQGEYDHGNGETDDLEVVLEYALTHSEIIALSDSVKLTLAGFSFGSFVQTRLWERLSARGQKVDHLILVGAAVNRFQTPHAPSGTLVIHGETDDVVPLSDVLRWAETSGLAVTVIPGADHFFHRKLPLIKQIVQYHLRS